MPRRAAPPTPHDCWRSPGTVPFSAHRGRHPLLRPIPVRTGCWPHGATPYCTPHGRWWRLATLVTTPSLASAPRPTAPIRESSRLLALSGQLPDLEQAVHRAEPQESQHDVRVRRVHLVLHEAVDLVGQEALRVGKRGGVTRRVLSCCMGATQKLSTWRRRRYYRARSPAGRAGERGGEVCSEGNETTEPL